MVKSRKRKGKYLLKWHSGVITYAKLMGVNSERVRVAMEAGEIVADLIGVEQEKMIDLRKYGDFVFLQEAQDKEMPKDGKKEERTK
ncbi:hypothetical protein QT327_16620 [Olivibacter sp. 47]|jgi:hypothetical protein|uniref:hypothetical protein n=1 Tax=Olivibacter sp. 47 TaxID=3056486 RepID=UPI0025A38C30|nr:hypothetical protein [Olivibacter sp. 47]MDM8175952.1 hypothetical protein [Olivibacter sp. 47]